MKFIKKQNIIWPLFISYIFFCIIFFFYNLVSINDVSSGIKIVYFSVAIFIGIFLCGILRFIINRKKMKIETIFLIVSLIIGSFYLIATPLFKGHDEQYQWYKVYTVSRGHILPTISDGMVCDKISQMAADIYGRQGNFLDIKYKSSFDSFVYSEKNKNLGKETICVSNQNMALYPFVQMLPQSIGVIIAHLLGFGVYTQAMFGRLFNLLVFSLLGYYAIKLLPFKKLLLAVLLLSPKVMYISTTLSGDVFTNSLIILFICYILNIRNGHRELNKKDYLFLTLSVACISVVKIVYLPIVLLLLLLPKNIFTHMSKKRTIILLFMLSAFLSIIWLYICSKYLINGGTASSDQVKFILAHPIDYIMVITRTIMLRFNEWSMDLVGGYMEWGVNLVLYPLISCFVYFVMLLSLFNNNDKVEIDKWSKVLIAFVYLAITGLILTALYVQWTAPYFGIGNSQIFGVQGRYFLPIAFLPILLLPLDKLKFSNKISMWKIFALVLAWQLPALLMIIVRNLI